MSNTEKFVIDCIVTGKKETCEVVTIETKPSGRGGQVIKFPQKPSCLNYQCSFRDTGDCPLRSLYGQE